MRYTTSAIILILLLSSGATGQTLLSFESCTTGSPAACAASEPWIMQGGTITVVPDGPIAGPTQGFPTDGNQWCIVHAQGSTGYLNVPPGGPAPYPFAPGQTAKLAIPLQIDANPGPTGASITIDANFVTPECPGNWSYNDFMTIDLTQAGVPVLNLFFVDTFSPALASPAVTPHEGGFVTFGCGGMFPFGMPTHAYEVIPIGQPKRATFSIPSSLYGQIVNLEIHVGNAGDDILFSWAYVDRIIVQGASIPPLQWQRNQLGATLDIDGVVTDGFVDPAVHDMEAIPCAAPGNPQAATGTLTIGSATGVAGWELVMSPLNLVSRNGGALVLSDNQLVNLDPGTPFQYMNGGTSPLFPPFPGASLPGVSALTLRVPFSITTALDVSMQGAHLGPWCPSGVALTQGTELHVAVTSGVSSIAGPVWNDDWVTCNVTTAPTCWCPSGIDFYGTNFSQIDVISNGRITFGGANTYAWPDLYSAMVDYPFVGFWVDLDPGAAGSITVSTPAPGVVRVDWQAVPYSGWAGTGTTFGVQLDGNTGEVIIDGLGGVNSSPGYAQFLGMSPGNLVGTTDPGTVMFTAGGSGSAALPTDMLYDFLDGSSPHVGLLPSLQLGTLSAIHFMPTGGNYSWSGL